MIIYLLTGQPDDRKTHTQPGFLFAERPVTGKTGDLGVKNNKETCIFFKTTVFSICPGRKSRTKNGIFLKKGGLLEWPTSKQ